MRQEIRGFTSSRVGIGNEVGLEIREPLGIKHLLGRRALLGVNREAHADEIMRSLRDVCPVLVQPKLVVAA